MTTPRDIADRIKAKLKADKRSVQWLSDETGIAYKTLWRRLAAPGGFTIDELSSISRAQNTPLEDLLVTEAVEVAA
jgi:hypothetical protein